MGVAAREQRQFGAVICGTVFVDGNARGAPEAALESWLDDRLYLLNEEKPSSFPRSADAYLAEWTKDGWLRKYYPPGEDEAHFDATAALEKAVAGCGTCPHVRSPEYGHSVGPRPLAAAADQQA
ncbi:DUF3375 family protein [Streptomyces klenkii]|uniref:DUF3375 family protein n=1 Tax=Streptomyces klenkii TaxID=1420899 RepID=UPI0036E12A5E